MFGFFGLCSTIANAEELQYGFTLEEKTLLSQMLSGDYRKDGDGEYDIDYKWEINKNEVYKVLCIVMNRQRSPKFPNKIKDILLAKKQFSVFPRNLKAWPSVKTWNIISEWCTSYDLHDPSIQVIPKHHLYFNGNGTINKTR
jgi:hypothetical protein